MLKRFLTIILTIILSHQLYAQQNIALTMSAPNAVSTSDQFRLTFTINARGSNLRLPANLDNFEILMGPSTSQSSSIQIINGRTSQTETYSYTYILRAKSAGVYEIRPASIEVDGEIYESNTLNIQVVEGNSNTSQQPSGNNNQDTTSSSNVNSDELFIALELNKSNVFKGEQIIATVKLYASPEISLAGFEEVNLPTYEGFYTQDIEMPQQIELQREVYNNNIYQVGILKKTILFPQQNGSLTIQPFNITCLVNQQISTRSIFDDFFGNYRTVRSRLISKAVTINVKELPNAPESFYGGVGNFTVNASLNKTENITTNDAITLNITVNGTGNIRLIQTPEIEFPPDFEIYDPQTNENIRLSESGMSGSKTFEYLFLPRFEGDYTIPPVEFSYFNPSTGQYVRRSTNEFNIQVVKGNDEQSATIVSSIQKEDVQLIGQDIRFIKQDRIKLQEIGHTFFGTTGFYSIYAGSSLVFLFLFLAYRKKARENANAALSRNKKANKMARKKLQKAYLHLKNNEDEAFYEAILKAFWGYLSDKLNIAIADLNREKAMDSLTQKQISSELKDEFVYIIEQCEFARFSPNKSNEIRQEFYKQAISVMSRLEKQIKR